MKPTFIVSFLIVFLFLSLIGSGLPVHAIDGDCISCTDSCARPACSACVIPTCETTGSRCVTVGTSEIQVISPCDPLKFTRPGDKAEGLKEAAGKIVLYLLMLLGAGAFLMFLFGGVRIMLARGDQKMVDSGRKTILYAFIGLAVIFLSYAVLSFVLSVVTEVGAGGT